MKDNNFYIVQFQTNTVAQASRCIVTICLPGIITKPRVLASVWSSDRNSEHDPKITLASRSVHKNAPIKTRPSVIFILKFRFSHPRNFCFAGDSSVLTVFTAYYNYISKLMLI